MENLNVESTREIAVRLIKKNKWVVISTAAIGVAFLFFLPQLSIFIVLLPLIYYFIQAQRQFMQIFAVANGLTYIEKGNVEDCRGRLFEEGHSREVYNILSGHWHGFPVRIYNYSYTTGSGKNRSTHYFTVFEIALDKIEFPFIFLKSKKMWGAWLSLGRGDSDVSLHRKDFSLSVAPGYEIEALQIFSEQLLNFLAEKAPHLSIEFSGNRINLFDDQTLMNKKELILLFDVGKHIIDSSGAFISRLHDDFAALHTFYQKEKI